MSALRDLYNFTFDGNLPDDDQRNSKYAEPIQILIKFIIVPSEEVCCIYAAHLY